MLSSRNLLIWFFSIILIWWLWYIIYDIFGSNYWNWLDYCDVSSNNSWTLVYLADWDEPFHEWQRERDDGNTVRSSNWKYINWEREWERVFMYNNGEKLIWNYINWNEDWCRVRYRSGWKIKSIENYINWKARESNWYEFYEDGEIKKITSFYKNDDGAWIQERIEYYHDWKTRSKWSFTNTINDWGWVKYYTNWNLQYKKFYIYWVFDWDSVEYYNDGKIAKFEKYNKWDRIWEWRYYDRDWNITWKADYWLDYNMYYYDSWELKEKWKYDNDFLRDWERTRYYKNGNIIDIIIYENWKIKDWEYKLRRKWKYS